MQAIRNGLIICLLLTIVVGVSTAALAGESNRYVASTAWTAAIAQAAGAEGVKPLAPFELKHPPEYDFRPADLAKVLEADVIFWGGYEGFIRKLVAANDIPESKLHQVMTNNNPDILKQQTRLISQRIGTTEAQGAWEAEFDQLLEKLAAAAKAHQTGSIKVVVNFHQAKLVEWLGYDVVGVFGQDELTPRKIGELLAANPALVIDNWHNAGGRPIAETAGIGYVELLNFPGTHGTQSIESLLEYNAKALGLLN